MEIAKLVLSIIDVLAALFLVAVVLLQSGKSAGLSGAIAGVAEAITYARANGLDLQTMLDTISTGAAGSWQMTNNGPKMLNGDYAPGFFVKHYIKDLTIAAEGASDAQVALPVLDTVLGMYKALADKGLANEGTQALIEYFK